MDVPEFEGAVLPIKRKVGDRDGAGGTEDGWWQPGHSARIVNEHIAGEGKLEGAVIAVGWGPWSLCALGGQEGEEGRAGRVGGAG